jgi:transposase
VSVGTAKPGQEHDPTLEYDRQRYGAITGRRRGYPTARVFETYVGKALLPSLRPGQIVVMDNLGAHRPKRIGELIEQQGCELLYLPAYSPDYNPIEEAFSKIKNLLRKAVARSKEALIEAIGAALSAVTATDARGFFEHAGYRPVGQTL